MPVYYTKRAREILRNEGGAEFVKCAGEFIIWNQLFSENDRLKFNSKMNDYLHNLFYDAVANPFKTITVDTGDIKHKARPFGKKGQPQQASKGGLGQIQEGDWDQSENIISIDDFWKYKGFKQRFLENYKWDETDYFHQLKKRYKNRDKHKKRGFDTIDGYLMNRCKEYEDLYYTIKNEGYRANHGAPRIDKTVGNRTAPTENISPVDSLEVLLTIGRNGEFHLFTGDHRFSIAKILDIKIPVQVLCRHKKWQKFRDDVYNNGLSERQDGELQKHPDLQDIIGH